MSRARTFKLTIVTAIVAMMSFGFTADTASHSNITAPAAASCTGTATFSATSGDQPGITYPVTTDGGFEDPRDFDWSLVASCEVAVDGGATVYTNVPLDLSGTANGYCGASTVDSGNGTLGDAGTTGSVNLSNVRWEWVGTQLVISFNHDAHGPAANGGEGAIDVNFPSQDWCWTHQGMTGSPVFLPAGALLSTSGEVPEVVDPQDPESRQSEDCRLAGGDRVVDTTVLGVREWVYVHQPTADELWVCARVEDETGEGYGGRLEVTPTELDPQVTGGVAEPEVDGASTACTTTTPNEAPGTRPIAAGGVGPVDYMLDAYLDGDEAWLCLQVGDTDTRVMVPLGVDQPGVSFGSAATWWPDEGTPAL